MRVAAEWWYLRYRFGRNFTPAMHMTTVENAKGDCFSVHNIALPNGSRKQVFFRLRGGLRGTAASSTQRNKADLSLATAISDPTGATQPQTDLQQVSDYIAKVTKLPETGLVWLLGWNIVAGQWNRIGLGPQAAKEYLMDLVQVWCSGT
jgi:hypothetical protein